MNMFPKFFLLSAFPEVMTGAGLEDVRRGVCVTYIKDMHTGSAN